MKRIVPSPRLDAVVILGLTVAGIALRYRPLNPSSLWLDDAWPALVSRADGLDELWVTAVTAPGWTLLLAGWLGTVGFDEWRAQALAFIAGVAAGPLIYMWWRHHIGRSGALLASGLILTSPVAISYSTRVKPYTLEIVIAAGLLALALDTIYEPTTRRWTLLAAAAIGATVFSAALGPVAVAALLGAGLAVLRSQWKPALLAGATYSIFAIAWGALVILPRRTDELAEFWSSHYISNDDYATFVSNLDDRLLGVAGGFTNVVPNWLTLCLLALCAIIVAARRPSVSVLALTPLAIGVILATTQSAPLGGGRTDSFLYASLALLIGAALTCALGRDRLIATMMVGILVAALVLTTTSAPIYPEQDLRPLVQSVEVEAGNDPILLYPPARWAYALYTSSDVDLQRDGDAAEGFEPQINDERVQLLGRHRATPSLWDREIRVLTSGHDHVWFIGVLPAAGPKDQRTIEGYLAAQGFTMTSSRVLGRAWLSEWERF